MLKPREGSLDGVPFKSHMTLVDAATYSVILDTVVVACTDICVLDGENNILLGLRQRKPLDDVWWTMGGRMFPGESFGESAARKLIEEIGIRIAPSRFQFLNLYSWLNGERAQSPQENGCHMIDIMMVVEVKTEEASSIQKNCEYFKLKWWKLTEVISRDLFISPLKDVVMDLSCFLEHRDEEGIGNGVASGRR